MHVPDQPTSPFRFLVVSVDRRHDEALFEPVQLGYKILDLFLDVFEILRVLVSAVVRHRVTRPIPRNV